MMHRRLWLGLLCGAFGSAMFGCSGFNFPFAGQDVVVVGHTAAPRLQFLRISADKNSLEVLQVSGLPSGLVSLATSTGLLASYDGSNALPFSGLGNQIQAKTEVAQTTYNRITLSTDAKSIYFHGTTSTDTILVRSISGGSVSSTALQTKTLTIGDEVTVMAFGSDGTFALLGDAASNSLTNLHLITRSSTGELGSVVASVLGNPEAIEVIRNIPALGQSVFIATLAGGSNTRIVNASRSSLSVLYDTLLNLNKLAVHPTKPWVYVSSSTTTIQRYVVSTSTTTLASTNTVTTRTTTTQLLINSDGDRLLELADGTSVRMYAIAADGSLTFLTSKAVSSGTFFEMWTMGRELL